MKVIGNTIECKTVLLEYFEDENENIAKNIQKSFVKNLKSPLDYRKLSDDIYMYKKI